MLTTHKPDKGLVLKYIKDLQKPIRKNTKHINKQKRDFPGGAVVNNPPANGGDTGSIPGPGRSHMPQSN